MRRLALIVSSILFGAALGCTSLPTQEMSDARQAISAARDVGAETSAAFALGNAERFLSEAESALQNGEYDASRKGALAAKVEAVKARNQALTIRQQTQQAD